MFPHYFVNNKLTLLLLLGAKLLKINDLLNKYCSTQQLDLYEYRQEWESGLIRKKNKFPFSFNCNCLMCLELLIFYIHIYNYNAINF